MIDVYALLRRAQKTQHGFGDLRAMATEIVTEYEPREALRLAKQLFASDAHQARMVAAFAFGMLASQSAEAVRLMRTRVSKDVDWRVQEILAQAFDLYCRAVGYEQALPIIADWLSDKQPSVRRAVSEGLRIWTSRPYFKEQPAAAIRLLSQLKYDKSEYVRRSAGNAPRDISRKHAELVRAELKAWDVTQPTVAQTRTLASQFLMPKAASKKLKGI